MYAIVEIAGQQFKVEKDRKVYVHRLAAEEGAQIEFDSVLLVDNDGQVKIGTPKVEGAKVTAKVVKTGKGKKINVFTYRSKKGSKRALGHRQPYTKLTIEAVEG